MQIDQKAFEIFIFNVISLSNIHFWLQKWCIHYRHIKLAAVLWSPTRFSIIAHNSKLRSLLDPYPIHSALIYIGLPSFATHDISPRTIGSALYSVNTVYPKKYAHGFCFAVLCCGYTLTDFPISIRLTSLALWQSNDCPSASKATLMNMDKYFMWIHYERLHNHNKAKHNKTVCIFLGIYCMSKLSNMGCPHMSHFVFHTIKN